MGIHLFYDFRDRFLNSNLCLATEQGEDGEGNCLFSKDAGRILCVYFYINIALLKSTRSLIFRILSLRKRGSL